MLKLSRVLLALPLLLLPLGACSDEPPAGPASSAAPAGAEVGAASVSVVMRGLDSPRGLAWGPEGGLYVAEAGSDVATTLCAPVLRGANCYSGTGGISRFWRGEQTRVASGLPSGYNARFADIGGPQDIAFVGRSARVTIGWGGQPAARAALGHLGALFGTVLAVAPSGHWRVVADVAAFEGAENPAGGAFDSNPYGLVVDHGAMFVTDAGGNSLLKVRHDGEVSLVAVFPARPVPPGPFNPPFAQSEAVPTEVARGPDGALYVSHLTGVPFLPGAAGIYRVVPGHAPELYAGGFTQITDFDFARDGNLYVLQYASAPFLNGPGSLVRVAPNGARTTVTTALFHPTGVLAGHDGAVYVSNKGNLPRVGEVLRIVP